MIGGAKTGRVGAIMNAATERKITRGKEVVLHVGRGRRIARMTTPLADVTLRPGEGEIEEAGSSRSISCERAQRGWFKEER